MPVNLAELHSKTHAELLTQAEAAGIENADELALDDLVFALVQHTAQAENQIYGRGVLEVHGEGFGFLRSPGANYLPGAEDIYVSQSQIRRFKLETGDTVLGLVRPPKEGERYLALLRVESVNGDPPGSEQPAFDSLTAIYPDDRLSIQADPQLKAVDFVAPLGLGQRGLIIAPSRTGREDLLRRLVDVLAAEDELALTVLLVEEKPEEIQAWRTSTRAEVVATTFDEAPARTLQIADIVFERARRRVERGDDVVVIVDSLSRLVRACLAEIPHVGRELGGIDASALHRLRRFMGSARALEEGGSLTVLGVLSGEPTSRTEQALIDDLRDVANWELTLSRDLADRGIRPAIDVHRSGNHHPQGLIDDDELAKRASWRKALSGDPVEDGAALVALLAQG